MSFGDHEVEIVAMSLKCNDVQTSCWLVVAATKTLIAEGKLPYKDVCVRHNNKEYHFKPNGDFVETPPYEMGYEALGFCGRFLRAQKEHRVV